MNKHSTVAGAALPSVIPVAAAGSCEQGHNGQGDQGHRSHKGCAEGDSQEILCSVRGALESGLQAQQP